MSSFIVARFSISVTLIKARKMPIESGVNFDLDTRRVVIRDTQSIRIKTERVCLKTLSSAPKFLSADAPVMLIAA